jgi:NAD(P)-dependent dehydrogenase (short-subunit alcohol dehydrogenase family)
MRRLWIITGATAGLGQQILAYIPVEDIVLRIGKTPIENRPVERQQIVELQADLGLPSLVDVKLQQAFDELLCTNIEVKPAVLINCAAENLITPTRFIEADDFERILNVNVVSPALIARTILHRVWRPDSLDQFVVVNIGSNAAKGAGAHSLAYVASKHALTGVTRSLARDYAGQAIIFQVNFGKLEGTRMTNYIDQQQAKLKGTSVAEERLRQSKSWAGGIEISLDAAANFVMNLISDPGIRQFNGGIFDYGC